jgi:hypothetical protein
VIPNPEFQRLPKPFWAAVRSISQHCGYTTGGAIKVPSIDEMRAAYAALGLEPTTLDLPLVGGRSTGQVLHDYFIHRARALTEDVEPALMDVDQARTEFQRLRGELTSRCPFPMNKQKAAMKAEAYLACMVNMLVEAHSAGHPVDYDPHELTTVTAGGAPLRTLSRRVDGAFPSTVNPIAIWEVKEYYYTTTFGSRVADGVYESLLDGMELEELRTSENVDVLHYLMLDAHFTWWKCGRSYLCRILDMLHMGYVDEVLVGRQVIERLPQLVPIWIRRLRESGRP